MIVIGNGESRKNLDISKIKDYKIGCNAVYRDFSIDELVCVDRRMVKEAIDQGFTKSIYTRLDWMAQFSRNKNVKVVPHLPYKGTLRMDNPFQWGSGPYALLLATKYSKRIKIFGFDLYSENKNVNNIYKDTLHYDKSSKHAVDPSYWIHQIAKVIESFPKKRFEIYQKEGWTLPESWRLKNVSVDIIDNL